MSRTVVSSTTLRAGGRNAAGTPTKHEDLIRQLQDDRAFCFRHVGTSFYSHSSRSPSGDRCRVSYASSRSEALPSGTRSLGSKPIRGVTCLSFVLSSTEPQIQSEDLVSVRSSCFRQGLVRAPKKCQPSGGPRGPGPPIGAYRAVPVLGGSVGGIGRELSGSPLLGLPDAFG